MNREANRIHFDRLLDEALMDTFPASDPPSITLPQALKGRAKYDRAAKLA